MALLQELVKIPQSRIAVVIGPQGKTKKELEHKTKTKLYIDSQDATIEVKSKSENTTGFYIALDIIKAIGRGFSPENAFLLLRDTMGLSIISISDWVGGSEKELQTKRGRIIGKQGKAREEIEQKTNCKIAVQGKTIAIIGSLEDLATATKAVEMLLQGARHTKVFKYLNQSQWENKNEW